MNASAVVSSQHHQSLRLSRNGKTLRYYSSLKFKDSPKLKVCKGERGATLLESAIVTPILALLMFGVAQYGFILAGYITLRNASSTAARTAAVTKTTSTPDVAQTEAVARAALEPMFDSTKADVVVTGGQTVGGFSDGIQVYIEYDLELFFPLVVPSSVAGKFKLKSAAVTR